MFYYYDKDLIFRVFQNRGSVDRYKKKLRKEKTLSLTRKQITTTFNEVFTVLKKLNYINFNSRICSKDFENIKIRYTTIMNIKNRSKNKNVDIGRIHHDCSVNEALLKKYIKTMRSY